MNEQEYRKEPGLNYSSLAQFAISQDHALMATEPKSHFEHGKMFEMLLQDVCKDTSLFNDKYFKCGVSGSMPDDLISKIESGYDLKEDIVYTQKGDRNKTYKTKHAYIDACLENSGKYPVGVSDIEMITKMAINTQKAEIDGVNICDMLKESEWQVPIFWSSNGIKKKALVDALYSVDGVNIGFDIKTAANMSQFYGMARKKYYIQDVHYSEGIKSEKGSCDAFYFVVAYKEKPYLCVPYQMSYENDTHIYYDELCNQYVEWVKAGKPSKGYLDVRTINI